MFRKQYGNIVFLCLVLSFNYFFVKRHKFGFVTQALLSPTRLNSRLMNLMGPLASSASFFHFVASSASSLERALLSFCKVTTTSTALFRKNIQHTKSAMFVCNITKQCTDTTHLETTHLS
jgi:hypothetical protein